MKRAPGDTAPHAPRRRTGGDDADAAEATIRPARMNPLGYAFLQAARRSEAFGEPFPAALGQAVRHPGTTEEPR